MDAINASTARTHTQANALKSTVEDGYKIQGIEKCKEDKSQRAKTRENQRNGKKTKKYTSAERYHGMMSLSHAFAISHDSLLWGRSIFVNISVWTGFAKWYKLIFLASTHQLNVRSCRRHIALTSLRSHTLHSLVSVRECWRCYCIMKFPIIFH